MFYSIKEGFLGLKRAKFSAFISITTISLTLSLFSLFSLITYNATRLVNIAQQRMNLEIFIDNSLDDKGITILENKLLSLSSIKRVDFIDKETALKRFQEEFGESMFDLLGDNPLPASFIVFLNNNDYTLKQIQNFEKELRLISGVEDVVYHGDIIYLIEKYRRIVYIIDIVLFAIAIVSTLLLVANTLRLTILTQKKTIDIMKLVGATRAFILRPYLVQGLLEGTISGAIATFILWCLVLILRWRFPQLITFPAYLYLTPLYLGIVLGFSGSWVGVKRFLSSSF